MNQAQLIGRVGRDPEVRRTQSGDAVVSFSLATSEVWKDKASGERKERTTWHNITIFNENIGRVAEQYVRKGSQVFIQGAIQTREYTDRDGNQRKATEIVLTRFDGKIELLGKPGDGGNTRSEDDYGRTTTRDAAPGSSRSPVQGGRLNDIIDDDIPF